MTATTATITPDVNPQTTPAPVTPAPSTPAQPTLAPQPAPAAPSTPAQPPTPRSLHASIFEGVLKTLGGGTQYINKTDPETGAVTREPLQQSKGQLGKSILAGALAGMFGGMGARDAEGRHDPLKAAQQGFEAGGKPMEEKVAGLQKTADEDISRRQMVMKNNMDLVHQQIAMTNMQHSELQTTADNNNKGILADAQEFDKNLTGADVNDPAKKAIQGRGLTYQEAISKLNGHWSDTQAIVDGYQDVRNPQTGQMEVHPTYAVLNPNVTIKMSEQQAADLAKFKPAYQNAYAATGGNLKIPLNRYVADVHQLNSLNQTEAFFENVKDQIGLKGTPDFAAIARKGGQPILDAVKDVENAIGQGGSPVDALRRLSGTGGGAQILKEMGISNDQVESLYNDQVRKNKLAQEGGMGEKAPAAPTQVDALVNSIKTNPDMTDADKKALMVDVPAPDAKGHINMTQGQVAKVVARQDAVIASNKGIAEKNALANGDPVAIKKTASNIIEGDVNNITKVASMRGNARQNLVNGLHDEAEARGLDTTKFTEQALENKGTMSQDYAGNKKGSTGATITSFNAFVGHTAGAVNAEKKLADKTLGLTRQPYVNTAMDVLGKQVTNDPDWKDYQTSLIPVQQEIQNFLAAGYATKSEDSALMNQVLDVHETPARITAALRRLAETADVRLAAMGQKYLDTMDTTYPHLLSADSINTFKNLGIDSKAAKLSQPLPRGWKDNQYQQMTDKNMALQYFNAAGRNKEQATYLAKQNGWILN